MQSEDRSFSYWLDYFGKNKPSLAEFLVAIEQKDTYFLNHEMPLDYNDQLYEQIYPAGFIESDFIKIGKEYNTQNKSYYQTRVALYLYKGLNLDLLKKRISKESFEEFIGDVLVNGCYEEFNIEFHQIMTVLFKNKMVSMDNLMDWGFLYGARLGETYGENYSTNNELVMVKAKNLKEIELLKLSGIVEPENVKNIGDTGNDWSEEE